VSIFIHRKIVGASGWRFQPVRLGLLVVAWREVRHVRRIRAATRLSQPLFARLLGVDTSAVAQWESGAKRRSGPCCDCWVLDPEKPDSPVVQVRRGIMEGAV